MIEQTPNAPPAEVTVQKTMEDCQRYREKLYWRCRLYFRDWPDYAEDCVQEAYIELMQALRAGRCIHNYEAWLFKVAILKGQVMIREEKMRREMQFENSSDKVIAMEQAGIYQQTFPSETDPDPTDEEIRRRAVTVLSKLNDTDRRIYYEHYVRRKTAAAGGSRTEHDGERCQQTPCAIERKDQAIYTIAEIKSKNEMKEENHNDCNTKTSKAGTV